MAQKIGTSRFVIADAEKGKPSTGIVVYAALLWTYGLVDPLPDLADPFWDEEGVTLSLKRKRARAGRKMDNDF